MIGFIEITVQAGAFPVAPPTSQARGWAQTPTTCTPEQMDLGYQTLGVLPIGVVQPIIVDQLEVKPMMSADDLKSMDIFQKLHPLLRSSQEFLDQFYEILHNLGLVESNGVDFTVFQMQGSAKMWWQTYEMGRPIGSLSLTWAKFSQLFLDKFIPLIQRDELRSQFECLQ